VIATSKEGSRSASSTSETIGSMSSLPMVRGTSVASRSAETSDSSPVSAYVRAAATTPVDAPAASSSRSLAVNASSSTR
jgi:hypothetical protein